MRFLVCAVFIASMLVVLLLSCAHREADGGKEINLRWLPQIRSLSIAGSARGLVLVWSPSACDLRLTTDGGQSWQVLRSGKKGDAIATATLKENGLTWAVNRRGEMFRANSVGASWRTISNLEAASQGDLMEAEQIEFPTESDGWLRAVLSIWRTKDGGTTWEKSLSVSTPGIKGQPSRIFAIDANVIVAAGTEGQIYRTEDGGRTWKIKTLLDADAEFKDVWFSDKQNGFVVGSVSKPSFRPLLFATRNAGETWEEMPIEDQILPLSVSFVKDDGWLAGRDLKSSEPEASPKPLLLHTADGGLHWSRVTVSSGDPFFSLVRFADKDHGWLVGRDNLYRTDDAGRTWNVVLSLPALKDAS